MRNTAFASLLAFFFLLLATPGFASETLFYTGDPDNVEAIGDYYNPLGGPLSLSQVYEPFTVTSTSGWDIHSVFFNELDLATCTVTSAQWSIRINMAPGVAGTEGAGGMSAATESNGPATTISVSGLNVILEPGTYWLNITPDSATGRLFADSTSGSNSQDVTLQGQAIWYEPNVQDFSPTSLDFSAGATGEVVPEPSTFWIMLSAAIFLAILLAYRRPAPNAPRSRLRRVPLGLPEPPVA